MGKIIAKRIIKAFGKTEEKYLKWEGAGLINHFEPEEIILLQEQFLHFLFIVNAMIYKFGITLKVANVE